MPKTTARLQADVRHAARVLDKYKVDRGCQDCGYNSCPAALHFDHTDPQTKRSDLGWVSDRSRLTTQARLERFIAHVERHCVIRCANCHAERTTAEGHWAVRRTSLAPAPLRVAGLF